MFIRDCYPNTNYCFIFSINIVNWQYENYVTTLLDTHNHNVNFANVQDEGEIPLKCLSKCIFQTVTRLPIDANDYVNFIFDVKIVNG